jgi:hypothetical protein
MARWIISIEGDLAEGAREQDYLDYQEQLHVPDALEFGCVSVKRLIARDPGAGRGKYVGLYEVESDDVDRTIRDIEAFMAKKGEQGRMPGLGKMVARTVFQVVSHHSYETFAYSGTRKFA